MKKILLLITFAVSAIFSKAQSTQDLDSLLKLLAQQKDTSKLSNLPMIGRLYSRKGLHDSALYYLRPGLDIALKSGTKTQIRAMHLAIGEAESKLSRYDAALEQLFAVLRMAEKDNSDRLSGLAKKEIGAVYIYQKKEKEALPYLLAAETILQNVKDTIGLLAVYSNLPVCIALLGDTAKSMTYFKKGFDIVDTYAKSRFPNTTNERMVSFKLAYTYNMNNFLSKQEDLVQALKKMEILKKEVLAGTNAFQHFVMYCYLADICLRLKQYENAQAYGEEALKIDNMRENYTYLTDVNWVVALSSASLKQYEKAYNHLRSCMQNNDSIFKFSQIEAINAVEVKYQVEKKDQEIITLNKEKKTQRIIVGLSIGGLFVVLALLGFAVRSKKLQKKLFDKEKEIQKKELEQKMAELEQTALRAQMNPHFIFNCLNSVNRFIIGNDPEGANHYLTTFANLIRQTLENSGKPLISFKDEIKYLETYIKMEQLRSNNRFDYNINISTGVDMEEMYIPNMIVQPFVENSIHHGMLNTTGRKGMIKLDISKDTKLTFVVDDNGDGIKNKNALQQNPEGHRSMGGAITEKRIAMYNSLNEDKIELEVLDKSETGSHERGTRIILKFPLSN